jgi:hypothetical protein
MLPQDDFTLGMVAMNAAADVAGPFDTYNECMTVMAQQTYRPGGAYPCDVFF